MWAIDGIANFLPYAGFPLLILVPVALFRRRPNLTKFTAVPLLVWVAALVTPNAFLATARDTPTTGPELRVVTANVLMSNTQLAALADDVLAEAPDVIVFEELQQDLPQVSRALATAYPFRISTQDPWVTLASRFPLEDARRLETRSDDRGRDLLTASLNIDGQRVTVIAVHLMPPLNAAAFETNRAQREVLDAETARASGPLMVIGDFNATTFSPSFAGFLINSGLRIAASDRTLEPTFFAYGLLGIRIDHILARNLDIHDERVFALTGSDHRGVSVEVSVSGDRRVSPHTGRGTVNVGG